MANSAVMAFLDEIATNKELQIKIAEILKSGTNNREEITNLAKEYNYEFTRDELREEWGKYQEKFTKSKRTEQDDELKAIAELLILSYSHSDLEAN